MDDCQAQSLDLLRDLVKINAIIATELIQLVENSSKQVRGKIPDACIEHHLSLRTEVVEIAEKWNKTCDVLRAHNLKHD